MKQIYAKTGVKRQTELIRMLLKTTARIYKVIRFSLRGDKVQSHLSPVQVHREVYPTSFGEDKSLNAY